MITGIAVVDKLYFTSGYKHMVERDMHVFLPWLTGYDLDLFHIRLKPTGWMTIKRGWGWDGCSGPTFDTKSTRRGGCVHDAVSYLMRREHIPTDYKQLNDCAAYDQWLRDGMWKWRANLWLWALVHFGKGSVLPANKRVVKIAP